MTKIKDIRVGENQLYIAGKIIEISEERTIPSTGDKVRTVTIEDDTGKCQISIYKEENLSQIVLGKVMRVDNAKCNKLYEGLAQLTTGKYGRAWVVKDG